VEEMIYKLLTWPVMIYLLIITFAFFMPERWFEYQRRKKAKRRQQAGLPADNLMNVTETLSQTRFQAQIQSLVFILAVIVAPFMIGVFLLGENQEELRQGLALAFVGMLVWSLTTGTDVAKAFLSGLSFRTLVAFRKPIQVGDRVTLQQYSGKVLSIGTFFVMLQTENDDLISIPTHSLWSSVLISANAGERYSLCVMEFYLAPFATQTQRQQAEDIIWDAIQASPYLEISQPMQIYMSQSPQMLQLTAKAYVASTYNEFLFKSDVTTAFLNHAAEKGLPLSIMKKISEVKS
jgi:small-conductance mechanosensitive channel